MKLTVTMKTPDAVADAIHNASLEFHDVDGRDEFVEKAEKVCGKWFEWGEYLTVEVDLAKKTIKVLPV